MKATAAMDPIHQFEIKNLLTLGRYFGHEIAFTNSALFMIIATALIVALMIGATSSRALVPGRLQSAAEMSYEFVSNTLRSSAGSEGMKFFPLVFTLFMFILMVNLLGMIPYTFTVTSHIIITVSLALLVFLTDRKSTRLNSSHSQISYAVFCLKKKNNRN